MYEAFLEGGGARKYNINFKAVFYGGLNTSVLEEMVFVSFYNCLNENRRDK